MKGLKEDKEGVKKVDKSEDDPFKMYEILGGKVDKLVKSKLKNLKVTLNETDLGPQVTTHQDL